MNLPGPVVLIDDDKDDQAILVEVLQQLGIGEVRLFDNCPDALEFLKKTSEKPFVILCDINLPRMNGLEFRREINESEYLRQKSIPFVFLSTSAIPEQVNEAYMLTVQGFFTKQFSMQSMRATLNCIMEYWLHCVHPNAVK